MKLAAANAADATDAAGVIEVITRLEDYIVL